MKGHVHANRAIVR